MMFKQLKRKGFSKVLVGIGEKKETGGIEEERDIKEKGAREDIEEKQERGGQQALLELPVLQAQQGLPDPQEQLERRAQQGLPDPQGQLERQAQQGLPDPQGLPERPGPQAGTALMEQQALLEQHWRSEQPMLLIHLRA
jgi:hypothetical protein